MIASLLCVSVANVFDLESLSFEETLHDFDATLTDQEATREETEELIESERRGR